MRAPWCSGKQPVGACGDVTSLGDAAFRYGVVAFLTGCYCRTSCGYSSEAFNDAPDSPQGCFLAVCRSGGRFSFAILKQTTSRLFKPDRLLTDFKFFRCEDWRGAASVCAKERRGLIDPRIFDIRVLQRTLGFVQPFDALVSGRLLQRSEKQ